MVDKPPGVVVHPGQGRSAGTLVQALAGRVAGGSDPERPGVVHRLDRDTSGLLVLARSEAAHAGLTAALRGRRITREYLALVEGRPPARTGTIDAPLGRDRRIRTRMSSDTDDPRPAITHFETERALPESTLLKVRLETGPDAPDPGASTGHRASRGRRPGVRGHVQFVRIESPVPAFARASRSSTR